MFASMVRALGVVLLLSAAACVCPRGQSCQPTGGGEPSDPSGPGGIRTGVVAIERGDPSNGFTVIGYMSQDPDPTHPNWNWWLLADTASLPLELAPNQSLRMNPVDNTGRRLTGAQLCTEFGSQLTTPRIYKEVSSVGSPTICE